MEQSFVTWKHHGITFLAFSVGESAFITDELGRNYGSWSNIPRFRKLQSEDAQLAQPIIGSRVQIRGHVTSLVDSASVA